MWPAASCRSRSPGSGSSSSVDQGHCKAACAWRVHAHAVHAHDGFMRMRMRMAGELRCRPHDAQVRVRCGTRYECRATSRMPCNSHDFTACAKILERDLENRCRPQTGPRRWMAGVREEYVRMRMRTICACAQYDVPAPARRPHPAAHSGPSPWPATDGFGTADFRPPFLLPSPTGRS